MSSKTKNHTDMTEHLEHFCIRTFGHELAMAHATFGEKSPDLDINSLNIRYVLSNMDVHAHYTFLVLFMLYLQRTHNHTDQSYDQPAQSGALRLQI